MPLAPEFYKKINGDVTGVGKAPLRYAFSKFRRTRISPRLKRFRDSRKAEKRLAGLKKIHDKKKIKPDKKLYYR